MSEPSFEDYAGEIRRVAADEEMRSIIEAAVELAVAGGIGVVYDTRRQYATPDTRVPAWRLLDVTECGIEGVQWSALDWQ